MDPSQGPFTQMAQTSPSHGPLSLGPHRDPSHGPHTTPAPESSALPAVRGLPTPQRVSAGGCLWHNLVLVPGAQAGLCSPGVTLGEWHPSGAPPSRCPQLYPHSVTPCAVADQQEGLGQLFTLVVLRPSAKEHEVAPVWHLEGPP